MKKLLTVFAVVLLAAVNIFAEEVTTNYLALTINEGKVDFYAKVKFVNYGVPSADFPHIEASLNGGDWYDPFVVDKFFDVEQGVDGVWYGLFYVCESLKAGDKLEFKGNVTSLDSYETGSIELHCMTTEVPLEIVKSGNASSLFNGTGEGEEPATGNFLADVEKYYPHEHTFTRYRYDNNATYVSNGTETAYCDHGCNMYDSRTVENTMLPFCFLESETDFVEISLEGMGYTLKPSNDDISYYYYGGSIATAESFEKAIKSKLSQITSAENLNDNFMKGEKSYSAPSFFEGFKMNVFVAVVAWDETNKRAVAYKPTKLVYTPSAGSTQQVVARVGDTMYLSIEEAMENMGDGQTLRLLSDIDLGSNTLSFGNNATIDLNGHTLTSSNENGTICVSSSATVSVTGTGTVENTAETPVAYSGNVSVGAGIDVIPAVGTPDAISTIEVSPRDNKAIKIVENGKVIIVRDDIKYDLSGRKI